MAININKAAVAACTVNGANVRVLTHCIRVYESMCKPYITAEIVLINENNFINMLQLKGGEPVTFTLLDSQGQTYTSTQYITGIPDEISSEGIRAEMVTLVTATIAYFKDRANLVQSSHVLTPVTAAISEIHSLYIGTPLKILMTSLGMVAKKEIGSYIVSNDKPFKSIRDLAARATYGGVSTGSTVYFENKYGHVLGPLEHIFATLSPNTHLVQKDTWGTSWTHMFGGGGADRAIIAAKLYKREDEQAKTSGPSGMAQAASQAQLLFDQFARTHLLDKAASAVGGLLSGFGVKNGGIQVTQFIDTARNEASVDPSTKTNAENAFQALVKDSPNYLVKVPIEAGLKCTVGEGVQITLTADVGTNVMNGLYLVADLMHEVYTDNRLVNGTSTMRAVKQV